MSDADAEPTAPSGRRLTLIMSGLLLSLLLAQLDNMIVGPAMPTIVGELRGVPYLAWVVTGYVLAMTVSTPIWGKLGDLLDRKTVFLAAIAVFLAGSALCGLAADMAQLVAYRAVQGLGAGGLVVGVPAIIGAVVPPRDRGRYTSLMMALTPIAMIGGPLVGGTITDHLSWRWAFYVTVPLGLVALVVVALTMKLPPVPRRAVRVDWPGVALLVVWIGALVLVVSWGGTEYAWGSWPILVLAAVAVLGFLAFLAVERAAVEPVMPPALFRIRNFALSGVLTFAAGFAMFGSLTYLPQFQQLAQGATATGSGLLLLPMLAAVLAANVAVGWLSPHVPRYRLFCLLGTGVMAVGMALCTFLEVDTPTWAGAVFMIVLGAGIGLLLQPTQTIAQNSVTVRTMGAAMGASTFLRNLGSSLGVAVLGSVYLDQTRTELTHRLGDQGRALVAGGSQLPPSAARALPPDLRRALGDSVSTGVQAVFWLCTALSLAAFGIAWLLREKPPTKPEIPDQDHAPNAASARPADRDLPPASGTDRKATRSAGQGHTPAVRDVSGAAHPADRAPAGPETTHRVGRDLTPAATKPEAAQAKGTRMDRGDRQPTRSSDRSRRPSAAPAAHSPHDAREPAPTTLGAAGRPHSPSDPAAARRPDRGGVDRGGVDRESTAVGTMRPKAHPGDRASADLGTDHQRPTAQCTHEVDRTTAPYADHGRGDKGRACA
ncbi:DHA2 family efflux MFS transporter permease subunit [Actinosynnema sp. NPDC020468]|uniref:MDR family MFS transporter n=1 Tax=Actinosynnema sp. NPDC020468 TaxID=3154488 RepID=UPI0033D2CC86